MKSIVIEQLEQRGLRAIFNDADFEHYKKKIFRGNAGINRYYAALSIFDMFVLNGKN